MRKRRGKDQRGEGKSESSTNQELRGRRRVRRELQGKKRSTINRAILFLSSDPDILSHQAPQIKGGEGGSMKVPKRGKILFLCCKYFY